MEEVGNHNNHISAAVNSEGGFHAFADLVVKLGTSTKTTDKLDALVNYFTLAEDKDKVWTIAIFSGRKPRRPVNSTLLAVWCVELAKLEWWLFEESYHVVGDLAETIALLLPEYPEGIQNRKPKPLYYYLEKLIEIDKQPEDVRKQFIFDSWYEMTSAERFVFNKFFTGGFRIGVSQSLIVNALAKTVDLPSSLIAHRISGIWDPTSVTFSELLSEHAITTDWSKPYPFYLAYAIDEDVSLLGEPSEWQAEWKWDGIRGQVIKRNQELFVWSRGEDLVTDKFPEYQLLKQILPDGTALDGEIICGEVDEGKLVKVLPFNLLQTRIGRKNVTKKQLKEAPVIFIAYDLLEFDGEDWREKTLVERRKKLEELVAASKSPALTISPIIEFNNWQ
ncbi:MAG: ATP-dependent DNA ligase, partial [Candidatus Dadabacteria bacterium]